MTHSDSPTSFWTHATRHFTYVWNRTKIGAKTNITLYEGLYKRKPNLKHVGVFGSDVWNHVHKSDRHTYDPKADAGIYLGHDEARKCAVVYILRTQKIVYSRDLRYRSTFDHTRALKTGIEADSATDCTTSA